MAVSSTSYRKAKEVKRTDRMNPGQWVWERGEMKRMGFWMGTASIDSCQLGSVLVEWSLWVFQSEIDNDLGKLTS